MFKRALQKSNIKVTYGWLDRPTVFEAMRKASVIVLPSRIESLGFALSEAAVLGNRVLASDIPAHRELADRLRAPIEFFTPDNESELISLMEKTHESNASTPISPTWLKEWDDLRSVFNELSSVT